MVTTAMVNPYQPCLKVTVSAVMHRVPANNVEGSIIPQVLHTKATDLAGGNFHYFDWW